jgi:hypothetical protein
MYSAVVAGCAQLQEEEHRGLEHWQHSPGLLRHVNKLFRDDTSFNFSQGYDSCLAILD